MFKIILGLLLLTASIAKGQTASGQVDSTQPGNMDATAVYAFVEKMPDPGYNISAYLAKAIKYPPEARKQKIEGKVQVRFIVGTDGSAENVEVVKPVHPLLDEEAIRVVESMPPWKPGYQNGKPKRVYFTLPINFHL